MALSKKIDFLAIISVEDANPNGDPLNGNRPRQHYDNTGFITPVCIKRKLRNRLQDMGRKILIQQNDRADDDVNNISDRLNEIPEIKEARKKKENTIISQKACEVFEDVRAFGATIALKDKTAVGIRGPVTIQQARSIGSVDIDSNQITKSTNNEPGDSKGSDTMGMMHTVRYGEYVIKGSINPILAEKTGFSDADAADLKEALRTLFVNDESSARPAGSMNVLKLFWWEQDADNIRYSTKRLTDTVSVSLKNPDDIPEGPDDFKITITDLPDIKPEQIEGF
ncbi:MAG: type I-C CRISPR-associated protein Cas7/Csd2 [Eubacterium sp.]